MKNFSAAASVFLLLCTAAICGCQKEDKPAGMPKLYPVAITVTVDGKPCEEVMVTLVPTGTFQWPIAGKTGPDGSVRLLTQGRFDGAPEGEAAVCLEKVSYEDGETSKTQQPLDPVGASQWMQKVQDERVTTAVIGTEYKDAATSPLKINVQKGKNSEKFDVPYSGEVL